MNQSIETSIFDTQKNRTKTISIFCVLIALIFFNAEKTKAQLFSQDFSKSSLVADYISTAPGSGDFNSINTTGSGTTVSITNGKLQFVRSGANVGSFARTANFSPLPATLLYKFDINVSGNISAQTSAAVFQIGSGFGTSSTAETNTNTYARIAINFTSTGGQFSLRDITNGTSSSTFSGTQTITWSLNNSGASQTYTAPDGTTENIADDKADIWVGNTKVFDDVNVQTATQSISNIKFVFNTGDATVQLDNFIISAFCEAPTVSSASISGISSVSGTFGASLLNTGGSGASITKRGFTFADNNLLSNPTDVSESGTFSTGNYNLNTTGLTPNTNYWYRAYVVNNCSNPRTAFSHSSAFPTFTTPHSTPVATQASNIGSSGFTANWQALTNGGNAVFSYTIEVSETADFSTIQQTQNNISSNSTSINISGLTAATQYWYRLKAVNNGGSSSYSNTIGPVSTLNPNPLISVSGSLNSFSNNSGNTSAEQTYTVAGTNLSSSVTISAPSGFEISTVSGSGFSTSIYLSPTNGSLANTTIYVRLNANTVGNYSANITHSATSATTQNLAVNGSCNASNSSDIIANSIFAYSSNINYALYQSATITNTTNSLGVFGVTLRDGAGNNDVDNLPTILANIKFNVTGIANIRTAALFSGNNLISNSPLIDIQNGEISFSGLSGANVTANDNSTKAINLRITFNSSVTDNQQLTFTINSAGTSTGNTSSFFTLADAGAAASYTSADFNRIEVSANSIKWNKMPENGTVGTSLSTFSIIAADANGNIDLDENTCRIVLSSSGNGFSASTNYIFTNGNIAVSDATFNQANTNITITSTAQSCLSSSNITSGNINITGINYSVGDKRTTGNGDWGNSIWETCTGTAPFTFSNSGNYGSAPDDTTSDIHIEHIVNISGQYKAGSLYIKKNGELKISSNTSIYEKLQVFEGGSLTIEAPLIISNSKDFIIEDGGSLTLNYNGLTSASALWNGIENFHDGSTINIKNWNFAATSPGNSLVNGSNNQISANALGYLFGNLLLNVNPTQDYTLISGNSSIKLCSKNLSLTNNSISNEVVLANSLTSTEIGGNLVINSGFFSFASLNSSGTVTSTIKGSLIINTGSVNLNKIYSSTSSSVINLYGDLQTASGTQIQSTDDNCKVIFSGTNLQQINFAGSLGSKVSFEAGVGSSVKLINQDFILTNNDNSFSVNNTATFDFNGNNITGNGIFSLLAGGTIKITSAAGITSSGNTGNVQTASRTFDGGGIYWYSGTTAQFTGNGLPNLSNDKVIIIDNTVSVQPSAVTRINANGRLEIRQGTLIETTTEYFADATSSPVAGQLVMSGGTYKIARTDVTVPQLSGSYTITGGTIELAAPGDQKLRGGRTYYNLAFTGSGIKTTGSAISNIGGSVSIKDNAILDVDNSTFSGPAALIMTGGRFRMRTLNTTLPQLTGTYTLSGGTIELYGTSATQTHTLRGGVTYNNVEINAAAANSTSGAANIVTGSSFSVNNEIRIKSPASFLIASNYNISGPGNFILEAGATLKYGSADGIKTSGTGSQDGNIRISGTRSFSTAANYAFTGSADMVAGSGLPAQVNKLSLEKSAAGSSVTLLYDVSVTTSVTANSGLLNTAGNKIVLGSTATITETSSSYITGNVETDRNVGTSTETFGGMGLSLTATSAPGQTKVTRVSGPSAIQTGNGHSGIARYYDISAANNSGLNATMVFTYTDAELNSISENDLVLFKSRDGGSTWELKGFTSRNATSNTVTLAGIDGFSRWTLGSSVTPLPVELISFNAEIINPNSVKLNWITASELNNDYFIIERSADGINFTEVGKVQGNGTTQTLSYYNFEDKKVSGTFASALYYRLKQVDYNSAFEYSEIKKIKFTDAANQSKVYFDQNAGKFLVTGINEKPGNINIRILDINGRELINKTHAATSGSFNINIPADFLSNGIYIININTEEGMQYNTRIVKY